MLYVLVNNDYHFHALQRHGGATLGGPTGVVLVTVAHALSQQLDTREFRAVHRFRTPLGRSRMPFTLLHYGSRARAVARTLAPSPGDTLLFFSEADWLNQIVVQHFRKRGAHIVMMDDGGWGAYGPMSSPDSEPLSARERCVQAAYRLIPGLRHSRLFKVNGVLWPRLPDEAIDVIGLYHDVALHRRVPTRQVRTPARKDCEVLPSTVIFLNQDLYRYYQTGDAYLAGLRRLLAALTKGFETVLFKFHPSEPEEWKVRIRRILALEFPAVNIIDRPGIIEDMIQSYRPEVLASYFSTALSNIEYKGIEPLYLYHLLDDVKDQPISVIISGILRMWGYRFVGSEDEIRSGYRSGIMARDSAIGMELRQLLSCSSAEAMLNFCSSSENSLLSSPTPWTLRKR